MPKWLLWSAVIPLLAFTLIGLGLKIVILRGEENGCDDYYIRDLRFKTLS
jgi:hypothetical protein